MSATSNVRRTRVPAWMGLGGASVLATVLFWQARAAMHDTAELVVEHQVLHYSLGEFHLLTGDLGSAEEAFQRTLQNDPNAFGAHVALGKVNERLGRGAAAMDHYQQALSIMPGDADANVGLGNLLLAQGKVHEACDRYRQALQTRPQEFAALTNLAWIMATSSDAALRNGNQALGLIDQVLATQAGNDPRLLLIKAAAMAELSRFDEALECVTQAVELARQQNNQTMVQSGAAHQQAYQAGQPLRYHSY